MEPENVELTPVEIKAAELMTERWDWSGSPITAIGHCSTQAAEHAVNGRRDQSLFWMEVGLILCDRAGIEPGAILGGLRDGV